MAENRKSREAVAYRRTSSAGNVVADKDSEKRQRAAIQANATAAGTEIVDEFYDAVFSGADRIDQPPDFTEMLKHVEGNDIHTIIMETANRFVHDPVVEEVGYSILKARGVELIAADSPSSLLDDTLTAKLILQVLGAVAEFEKAMTVAKLRAARERKRAAGVKVEKCRSHAELNPALVQMTKRLRRWIPKSKQRSLRQVSATLFELGFVNANGTPFSASTVKAMLDAR